MKQNTAKHDLDHRPSSYWEHADPLHAILAGISGTARRAMITDYWKAGRIEELDEGLLQDQLNTGTRQSLGAVHPYFMGGEYLPEREPGEVAIVRIQLQSTTYDVIELRARPLPDGRIGLRWVDEYESTFTSPCQAIDRPFSFRELVAFIEASEVEEIGNLPMAYNDMNSDFPDADEQTIRELEEFTSLASDFYPQLAEWGEQRARKWVCDRVAALREG